MSDIVSVFGILGGSYVAKDIAAAGISLLKDLYGPSFKEKGEFSADEERLRRVENSVKIMALTQEKLKEYGLDPHGIPLKVMSPLINKSSLEEDEELQVKWSNLIANVLTKDLSMSLQQNAIEILSKMSNEEAKLLDYIYNKFEEKKTKYFIENPNVLTDKVTADWFSFKVADMSMEHIIIKNKLDLGISNLIAFGLIRWEVEVDVQSARASHLYDGSDNVEVYLDVSDNNFIRLTKLGMEFVELCKFEK